MVAHSTNFILKDLLQYIFSFFQFFIPNYASFRPQTAGPFLFFKGHRSFSRLMFHLALACMKLQYCRIESLWKGYQRGDMMFLCLVSASLCFVRSLCVQPVYLGAATRTMSEDIVMVWYGIYVFIL